ncbi:MAG: hypothetical protein GY750_06685 [Lentisphaerae bacterium]|nr:hypothetical protein [Lentisphaerota bacterium]MCP4101095.1 hypothetical protein [Lentisphaerota bacterium]
MLGQDHHQLTCNGDSFLLEFFDFLIKKKNIKNFKDHTIFFECFFSAFSHYKNRDNSDYSLDSSYRYAYNPTSKNENDITKYSMETLKRKELYRLLCIYEKLGIGKMLFFDDIMTCPDPNDQSYKKEPNYTEKKFNQAIKNIKKMYGLDNIPNFRQSNGDLNYTLRSHANKLIARRICDDICHVRKSFLTIGDGHICDDESAKSIPTLQSCLTKYLNNRKRVGVVYFNSVNEYNAQFTKCPEDSIVGHISWPACRLISSKYYVNCM